jgi:cyclophilin family peptidyl-prolyl cis-trans isomerase
MHTRLALVLIFATFAVACGAEPRPTAVPVEVRDSLKLAPFYQKYLDAGGLPVVGSARVSDNALAEAAWIIRHMLEGRPDLIRAMAGNKVRVVVMAADEYTTDIPEHSRLTPKLYWDRRARGLGATPSVPAVSCGEENLLGFERDPYPNENIFVHEFGHAIHGTGLNITDPTFDRRLRAAFRAARDRGLWDNTYAATNHSEYWAEGVQSWFDDNAPPDALHNHVRTRALLKTYDPGLAKLCEEVFGDREWRYLRPAARAPADRAHLVGYDPKTLPRFRWRDAPLGEKPRVTIQTSVGDFDVELDAKGSPAAARNFLRIANDGGYHSGRLDPVGTLSKPGNGEAGKGHVRATINPGWREKWLKTLTLDELPAVASAPTDGTIGMIRDKSGVGGFAVFAGDSLPGRDDVIPFGKVVKGMEVVRKMLISPTDGEKPKPPVDIRRVIRTE